jgi:hypothetical protein
MTVLEPSVLTGGTPIEERQAGLAAGADRLAGVRRSLTSNPRFLLTVAASMMTMGVTAILLGWFGAARSTLLEEQVPYLISGGLLGVALATIGALLLFTHWLTVSIRENREHETARRQDHAELVAAIRSLAVVPAPAPAPAAKEKKADARPRSARAERPIRGASSGT